MNYSLLGTTQGRRIFVPHGPDDVTGPSPQGYSIAAVALKDGWTAEELGWLLNRLYGALSDWTPFNPDSGARSFVFYGDRAEEASNLCDTFAYAWTAGAEQQYDSVIAASNDAEDMESFVEAIFSGEVSIGEAYAEKIANVVFTALVSDEPLDADTVLVDRLRSAVRAAVQQHRFD